MERGVGAVLALFGTLGGIIGASISEHASTVGAGAFTLFALSGFGLMWRAHQRDMELIRQDLHEAREEREHAARERATCEIRLGIVVKVLRENNMDVPAELRDLPTF